MSENDACYNVKIGQKGIEKVLKLACSLSRQEKRLEIKGARKSKGGLVDVHCYEFNF